MIGDLFGDLVNSVFGRVKHTRRVAVCRLLLELLEERDVPSTLAPATPFMPDPILNPAPAIAPVLNPMPPPPPIPMSDVLLWRAGTGSDDLYGTASNWWDASTNAWSDTAPTALDDIIFDSGSQHNCYTGTTEQMCQSLTIVNGWNGRLDLSGGTLDVSYKTVANSSVQLSSTPTWGQISANAAPGILNIWGGNFVYDATGWNTNVANPSSLVVNCMNFANVTVDFGCENIGAEFRVGDSDLSPNPANMYFNTTSPGVPYQMVNNAGVEVESVSSLYFENNSYISNFAGLINGSIHVGSNVTIGMAPPQGTLSVGRGYFYVDGNNSVLTGSLSIDSGYLDITSTNGVYYTFNISGILGLGESEFLFHVDGASNNSDAVEAKTVALDTGDTSICYTWGTPSEGNHTYNPMSMFGGNWVGSFDNYEWYGNVVNMIWTPNYNSFVLNLPLGYSLTGTIV